MIWSVPVVNYELMREAIGETNDIAYWSTLLDARNQTLTPNPDLLYLMSFLDLSGGPVVMEIPPADGKWKLFGNLCDAWQMPLVDVGPYGTDQGKGGKYLILPPGWSRPVPEGYLNIQATTTGIYALLRTVLPRATQSNVDDAVEYARGIQFYPLAQTEDPPTTSMRDLHGSLIDARIPWDLRFFETLDRFIQREAWLERDKGLIDPLATLGIRQGQQFAPDETTSEVLKEAVADAHEWLAYAYRETQERFYDNANWFIPLTPEFLREQENDFSSRSHYPYTARGIVYQMGFIGLKKLGAGQFYLVNLRDDQGRFLEGRHSYRLTVPAGVPVGDYWSAAVYDAQTHTFLEAATRFSVPSNGDGVTTNDDGSVDIYFGPEPIPGHEANWVPTPTDGEFEIMVRFYGLRPELFDKKWRMADPVRINETS